ncbi:MAG: hypothetical protein N3B16_01535 [Candidatus Aminicenantes bacterium]|nr:hypothetical protein [Candidatus Aminicenantes bacterium]
MYALLKGKEADIGKNILKKSLMSPEIDQKDIQLLLWAIFSRSKLSECNPKIKETASQLLTEKEIRRLEGGAIGQIPPKVLELALAQLPPIMRESLQVEAILREMLAGTVLAPYEAVERVAVRFADVLPPSESRDTPLGRWSYHPDGYFIRYLPADYSRTKIQVYHPEEFSINYDDQGLIRSIEDNRGTELKISYDHQIKPLIFDDHKGVKSFAFRELSFKWKDNEA